MDETAHRGRGDQEVNLLASDERNAFCMPGGKRQHKIDPIHK